LAGIPEPGPLSDSIVDVSDYGFDAYALDGEGESQRSHPLEIARDLIASGKPRAALEVLSEHHDTLGENPEYLVICSEAWWADGDPLRAQQALLGAARLAPDDPTPLLLLGELLQEDGQHEKAERVLSKAQALGGSQRDSFVEAPETADDLIAFAEQQERKTQVGLTPKQILLGALALILVGAVVGGIAAITGSDVEEPVVAQAPTPVEAIELEPVLEEAEPVEIPAPEPLAIEQVAIDPAIEKIVEEPLEAPAPAEAAPSLVAPAVAQAPVETAAPSKLETPRKADRAPVAKTKPAKAKRPAAAKPEPKAPAAPDTAQVSDELASLGPDALTRRADTLSAQGHSALSATYYRRALDLDPDYAPALVGIGRGILRAEKYSEAFANATRALQLARGVDARAGLEAEAIYQLARVHLHRDELDAARRLFRQSISLPGTPAAAWFYLGEALWTENSQDARGAYERYLELVPRGHLADRARRAIQ